jgi:hypothetical protein
LRQDVRVKKADPNAIVDAFRVRVAESLADWEAIDEAVKLRSSPQDTLRLRRRAASDSFLALVISWESFFSSWIVAAVNRAPKRAADTLAAQLTAHATAKLNIPAAVVSKSLLATSHLSLDAVRMILDSKGYNTTVRDHKELEALSDTWLAGPYKLAADSITAHAFSPALVGRLVRNALAHESEAALKNVNKLARSGGVKKAFRVTRARDLDLRSWRAYLFQVPDGESRNRVALFHQEFSSMAAALRTP